MHLPRTAAARCLVFAPDGELLAIDGAIVRRIADDRVVAELTLPGVRAVRAGAAGGDRLMVSGAHHQAIVIDLPRGALVEIHDDVRGAALSASGAHLALGAPPRADRTHGPGLRIRRLGDPPGRIYPPPAPASGVRRWVDDERDLVYDTFDTIWRYRFEGDRVERICAIPGRGAGGDWQVAPDLAICGYVTTSEARVFAGEREAARVELAGITAAAAGAGGRLAIGDHKGRAVVLRPDGARERVVAARTKIVSLAFARDGRLGWASDDGELGVVEVAAATW